MLELEQAAYEVEVFENHIEVIKSLHKDCSSSQIDWKEIALQPVKPVNLKKHEEQAKLKAANYRPGFIDRVLKQTEKKKRELDEEVRFSFYKDKIDHKKSVDEWEKEIVSWGKKARIAKKILSGDSDTKLKIIKDVDPFSELSSLGSKILVNIDEIGVIQGGVYVHGNDIVPGESKSLLKSGKLSVKKMPKGKFNEIYQDYVCSCVLRVARELFAIVPDNLKA